MPFEPELLKFIIRSQFTLSVKKGDAFTTGTAQECVKA